MAKPIAGHSFSRYRQPMNALAMLLAETARRLEAVSDTPRLDAELLLAHALGIERKAMLPQLRDLAVPQGFDQLVERRLRHEPVAYILGYQDFWDLTLQVTPDVLIPRADSETLIEAAAKHFSAGAPTTILDLGTGSGALLLAALSAFPAARGTAIDASNAALEVAMRNADRLGFGERSRFLHRSWRECGWATGLCAYDLILCNPPYVEENAPLAPQVRRYEPHNALFAGPDGLDEYRMLIPQIPPLLAPGGVVIFEIGSSQVTDVTQIAEANGFVAAGHRDLAGIFRALSLTKPVQS